MARTLYGGSGADLVAQLGGDGDFEPATANFLVYTDRAATNQVTDLRDAANSAITSVVPDSNGRILFFGVDGYKGPYYLRQASSSAEPWRVDPADHATRLVALEGAGGTTYYTLPAGGIPQTDLAAAVGAKLDGALPKSTVDAKGDLLAGTANDTVARQPVGANGQRLVADSTQPTGLAWQAPTDLTGYATKAGSVQQFADVSDVAFFDGAVPQYDLATGALEPTDLSARFAVADTSTGRLAAPAWQKYYRDIVVLNAGEQPPADIMIGAIGFTRPGSASLVPSLLADNSARGANNVVLTLPEALAVGDQVGVAIVTSGEVTPLVAAFTVAVSAGAVNSFFGNLNVPGTTAITQLARIVVTTLVPSGSTVTVTARDSANVAINRVHLLAAAYRLPNLVAASPLDQQAAGGAASSGTMTAVSAGPTSSATAQANEVAIGIAGWNSGVAPVTRVLAGTNSWTQLSQLKSDNGGSARSMFVAYKVLTSVGTPTFTTSMTSSDATTGAWAAGLSTYKGA